MEEGREGGRKQGRKEGREERWRGRGEGGWRKGKGIYSRSWRIFTDNVAMYALVDFIISYCGF